MKDYLDTHGTLSAIDAMCARQRLARDHAALFPTRLALTRWRSGASTLQEEPAPQRAAWFARIGRGHQAWLDRGGFAQHEDMPALHQPAMWQPPVAAPSVPPLHPQLEQPCNRDQDGAAECGACG